MAASSSCASACDTPALPLNGRKVWDDWLGFAQLATRRGLTPADVRGSLTQLARTLRQQQHLAERYADRVPASAAILQRMGEAWQRGRVRLERYLDPA